MAPVAQRARIPLVVHFHGWDAYHEGVLAQHRDGQRRLFRQAAAVVAVSTNMVEQFARLGADRARVHLNPCGVDIAAFSPAAASPTAPAALLAVGRFVEKKAPHLRILAFRNVAAVDANAALDMVGDGPLLGACRSLVDALGFGGRVIFHGAVPHAAVASRMRAGTCFVRHWIRSTDGDSEGMPVAVLEATASGLPVVATRHAGIAESVVHGNSGYLIAQKDVHEMGKYMAQFAGDRDLGMRMGRAGRQQIIERYSLDRSIDGLANILAEVASVHSGRARSF